MCVIIKMNEIVLLSAESDAKGLALSKYISAFFSIATKIMLGSLELAMQARNLCRNKTSK